MKTMIHSDSAPAALGPYSQAILAGDTLYCSGQLGLDPATMTLAGSAVEQAHQAFSNIEAVLKEADMTIQNVVKLTVFLKNLEDFGDVNQVCTERLTAPFPARSCVEVARLPKDALVEIEVIAHK